MQTSRLTDKGYVKRTPEEVKADLVKSLQEVQSSFFEQSADLQDMILDTSVRGIMEYENLMAEMINSYTPAFANKFMFLQMGASLGLKPRDEYKSQVLLQFTGKKGDYIPSGTKVDGFTTSSSLTLGETRVGTVAATSKDTTIHEANTLTNITTSVNEGVTVTNPAASYAYIEEETFEQFKKRAQQLFRSPRISASEYVQARLLGLDGVDPRLVGFAIRDLGDQVLDSTTSSTTNTSETERTRSTSSPTIASDTTELRNTTTEYSDPVITITDDEPEITSEVGETTEEITVADPVVTTEVGATKTTTVVGDPVEFSRVVGEATVTEEEGEPVVVTTGGETVTSTDISAPKEISRVVGETITTQNSTNSTSGGNVLAYAEVVMEGGDINHEVGDAIADQFNGVTVYGNRKIPVYNSTTWANFVGMMGHILDNNQHNVIIVLDKETTGATTTITNTITHSTPTTITNQVTETITNTTTPVTTEKTIAKTITKEIPTTITERVTETVTNTIPTTVTNNVQTTITRDTPTTITKVVPRTIKEETTKTVTNNYVNKVVMDTATTIVMDVTKHTTATTTNTATTTQGIECVVGGGEPSEVVNILFNGFFETQKLISNPSDGDTSRTVSYTVDYYGKPFEVKYTTPKHLTIGLTLHVKFRGITLSPLNLSIVTQEGISNLINTKQVGEAVTHYELRNTAMNLIADYNYDLTDIEYVTFEATVDGVEEAWATDESLASVKFDCYVTLESYNVVID